MTSQGHIYMSTNAYCPAVRMLKKILWTYSFCNHSECWSPQFIPTLAVTTSQPQAFLQTVWTKVLIHIPWTQHPVIFHTSGKASEVVWL